MICNRIFLGNSLDISLDKLLDKPFLGKKIDLSKWL